MDLRRFLKRKSAPTSPASLEITEGVSNAVEETGEKHPRTMGKYNHSTVWSVTPCVCIRKESVRRHSLGLQHKEATEKELVCEQSATDGGLRQLFQKQATLNKAAVKIAMECLYWLVKSTYFSVF